MAEIRIERKQHSSLLPWILGLVLLALLIWGLAEAMDRDEAGTIDGGAREVGAGKLPEDDIEPRFRQYAVLVPEPAPERAAA
ncbi:MAG TPA: hypothetical protein VE685_09155 [Thermoanaerobaculia bacterium]|nr:hypothetical protein [Thermoanaerobaculia bacterium]